MPALNGLSDCGAFGLFFLFDGAFDGVIRRGQIEIDVLQRPLFSVARSPTS